MNASQRAAYYEGAGGSHVLEKYHGPLDTVARQFSGLSRRLGVENNGYPSEIKAHLFRLIRQQLAGISGKRLGEVKRSFYDEALAIDMKMGDYDMEYALAEPGLEPNAEPYNRYLAGEQDDIPPKPQLYILLLQVSPTIPSIISSEFPGLPFPVRKTTVSRSTSQANGKSKHRPFPQARPWAFWAARAPENLR